MLDDAMQCIKLLKDIEPMGQEWLPWCNLIHPSSNGMRYSSNVFRYSVAAWHIIPVSEQSIINFVDIIQVHYHPYARHIDR